MVVTSVARDLVVVLAVLAVLVVLVVAVGGGMALTAMMAARVGVVMAGVVMAG